MRRTCGSSGLGTKERKKEGERELRDVETIRETTAPGNWTLVTRTRLRGKSDSAPSLSEYNCIYLDSPDWIIIVNEKPRERERETLSSDTPSIERELKHFRFPMRVYSTFRRFSLFCYLSLSPYPLKNAKRILHSAVSSRLSFVLPPHSTIVNNIIRLTEDRIFKENFWQKTSYISYSTAVFRLAFRSMGSRSTFHFQCSVLSILSRRKKLPLSRLS